jgi:N4-(beta-N-acetylglucosaminyl)-L-asparaginase
MKRRSFIKNTAFVGSGLLLNPDKSFKLFANANHSKDFIAVSTWKPTIESAKKSYLLLAEGSTSLDAIEAGIKVAEDDPTNTSVGYGGFPDEDGVVTLDASIMDWDGNAGAVAGIEGIKNPISVAKLVMQRTKHVMLVGEGAKKYALENGFKEENLLTKEAYAAWLKWKKLNKNDNRIEPSKNHDTIGMLAVDKNGNMSGGVSTSGMAWKIHGRVGDSPIIGAALFVDNEVGGAVATGNGEWVIKAVGSFLVVEKMREGFSPEEACKIAIERIKKLNKKNENIQAAFIALRKDYEVGAYSLYPGFDYCVAANSGTNSLQSKFLIPR